MKKNIYLGIGMQNKCCVLESHLPFDILEKNIKSIEKDDFNHSSTNWCGNDKINRTLEIKQLELTGRKIILNTPIVFYGADYDFGHKYGWSFDVYTIAETKERTTK